MICYFVTSFGAAILIGAIGYGIWVLSYFTYNDDEELNTEE